MRAFFPSVGCSRYVQISSVRNVSGQRTVTRASDVPDAMNTVDRSSSRRPKSLIASGPRANWGAGAGGFTATSGGAVGDTDGAGVGEPGGPSAPSRAAARRATTPKNDRPDRILTSGGSSDSPSASLSPANARKTDSTSRRPFITSGPPGNRFPGVPGPYNRPSGG